MSNPITPIASLRKDSNGSTGTWAKVYITSQTTTLVKSGPGILHSVTLNTPTATTTIELDDAITNTNPFAIITVPTAPQPVTLIYDVEFTAGLSITTAVANSDITVSFS